MRQVRVVLVEDHAPDVFLVQKALRDNNLDFHLTRYEDGEEALRELSKRGLEALEIPDVVVLDLNVPKIDGMGILRAIRTNPTLGTVPVVVLTSSRAAHDRIDAIASGADRFITKPIDLKSFVLIVGGNIKELIEERTPQSDNAKVVA